MCWLKWGGANWQRRLAAVRAASSWPGQGSSFLEVLCVERGGERSAQLLLSEGFLFPRRLELPSQSLSSEFLWDSRFPFPLCGPAAAALDIEETALAVPWFVLNPFCLCLELGALHADLRRSGHPALQGLRER